MPGIPRIVPPHRRCSRAPGRCTVGVIDIAAPCAQGLARRCRTRDAMAVPSSCLAVKVTAVSGQPSSMGICWPRRGPSQQAHHEQDGDTAITLPAWQGTGTLPLSSVQNWPHPDLPLQKPYLLTQSSLVSDIFTTGKFRRFLPEPCLRIVCAPLVAAEALVIEVRTSSSSRWRPYGKRA